MQRNIAAVSHSTADSRPTLSRIDSDEADDVPLLHFWQQLNNVARTDHAANDAVQSVGNEVVPARDSSSPTVENLTPQATNPLSQYGAMAQCPKCNDSFRVGAGLAVHLRNYHHEMPWKCSHEFCAHRTKGFSSKVHLRAHLRDEHGVHPSSRKMAECYLGRATADLASDVPDAEALAFSLGYSSCDEMMKVARQKRIKCNVKLVTTQRVLPDEPQEVVGFPMRSWEVSLYLVGPDGDDIMASYYERVTYTLHESFGNQRKQTFKNPPFTIKGKGWGEFDMIITLTPVGSPKGGDQVIQHNLHLQQERYETIHSVGFRIPEGMAERERWMNNSELGLRVPSRPNTTANSTTASSPDIPGTAHWERIAESSKQYATDSGFASAASYTPSIDVDLSSAVDIEEASAMQSNATSLNAFDMEFETHHGSSPDVHGREYQRLGGNTNAAAIHQYGEAADSHSERTEDFGSTTTLPDSRDATLETKFRGNESAALRTQTNPCDIRPDGAAKGGIWECHECLKGCGGLSELHEHHLRAHQRTVYPCTDTTYPRYNHYYLNKTSLPQHIIKLLPATVGKVLHLPAAPGQIPQPSTLQQRLKQSVQRQKRVRSSVGSSLANELVEDDRGDLVTVRRNTFGGDIVAACSSEVSRLGVNWYDLSMEAVEERVEQAMRETGGLGGLPRSDVSKVFLRAVASALEGS